MSVFSIDSLSIEGFGPFGARQTVTFPKEPGVYRLDGFNHVEPRLGSNGSGKTWLLNAISWVRYGKTTNGMFGPDVKSWRRTKTSRISTEVVENGTKDGVAYTIFRSQDPNRIKLTIGAGEAEIVTQDVLNAFLGRNYEMFLATTLFPSNGDSFMSLGPTAQNAKLSEVLNLDVWVERSKQAKAKSAELLKQAEALDSRVTLLVDRIAQTDKTIAEQLELQASHADKIAQEREADEAELAQLRSTPKAGAEPTLELESPAAEALQAAERALRADEFAASAAQQDLVRARRAESSAMAALSKLKSQDPQLCPTCGGPQGVEAAAARVQAAEQVHAEALEALKSAEAAANDAASAVERAKKAHDKRARLAAAEVEAQREAREAHKSALILWSAARAKRQLAKQRADAILAKVYREFDSRTLDRLQVERQQDEERLKQARQDATERRRDSAKFGFWVDGFLRIRAAEMDRACAEFSAYMLSAFEVLGVIGWEVAVSCTKELSNKDTQAKFNIKIKSPTSPDWVAWQAWSDGQRHRLGKAGDMAFADLASSRCGVYSQNEFWDEQTNNLSQVGCEDQMSYLDMRAQARKAVILAIDHRTGDSPVFRGLLWVDRHPTGSTITWKATE